ncbi:MAG: LPS export ABC transporter periplasmic protein LptC [Bacillota bacterium]|nr:LPS export ABC transporter periplasmic protein LptC [Bacillota bacterium]
MVAGMERAAGAGRLRKALSSPWLGGAAVFLAVAALVLLGRTPEAPVGESRPAGAGHEQPGFHFRDIRLVGRNQGRKEWELQVATVRTSRDSRQVDFYLVRRGAVYREGRPYLYVVADRGVYYPERGSFSLYGNIVVSRENGDLLRARELQWDTLTGQVTSAQPVEAKIEGAWFRADRLAVEVEAESLTASGGVVLVGENGERLTGEAIIYSLADGSWEIRGTAELSIRTGRSEPFVAPGLGGGGERPAEGRERE